MNQIFIAFIILSLIGKISFGQSRFSETGVPLPKSNKAIKVNLMNGGRSSGDTLMYIPLPDANVTNQIDQTNFGFWSEDLDGLTPYYPTQPMDFGILFSTNASVNALGEPTSKNYYHPWESPSNSDTAYYLSATSWFNPIGQANNWAMFGPVTIPDLSATLSWFDKNTPYYRDGYKVWMATSISGAQAYPTDFENVTPVGTIIFSRTDAAPPNPTLATDTNWTQRMAPVFVSSPGTQVWFGFQHDADNMSTLHLDNFLVTEDISAAIKKNKKDNFLVNQNQPNPFNSTTTIQFELFSTTNLNFTITDVAGRTVKTIELKNMLAGKHQININANDFASGLYYYTFASDSKSETKRMVLIHQ